MPSLKTHVLEGLVLRVVLWRGAVSLSGVGWWEAFNSLQVGGWSLPLSASLFTM